MRAVSPRAKLIAAVAVAAVLSLLFVVFQDRSGDGGDDGPPPRPEAIGTLDRAGLERRAARGYEHVLYAKVPGGIVASAARTARWRPQVEAAAGDAVDPDVLEGIVLLESAGREDARASDDLESAVGLTQILAETGQNLLGMRVDVAASAKLTRGIDRGTKVAARRAARRRVDQRFDGAASLRATVRYLRFAASKLGGREDLAVASYHMGVGNLQTALARYGAGTSTPYVDLFFGSTPLQHDRAYRFLAGLGDDSSTYLWRVRAAMDVMRRYRTDRAGLQRRAALHARAASAEYVLVPPGAQQAVTSDAALRWIRATVRAIAGPGELRVIGTRRGGHTTLVSRTYPSPAHAQAFQFALDRLTALNAIAYARDGDAIRITAGPDALRLPPTPRRP